MVIQVRDVRSVPGIFISDAFTVVSAKAGKSVSSATHFLILFRLLRLEMFSARVGKCWFSISPAVDGWEPGSAFPPIPIDRACQTA